MKPWDYLKTVEKHSQKTASNLEKISQQTKNRREFSKPDKEHFRKNLNLTSYLVVKECFLPKIWNKAKMLAGNIQIQLCIRSPSQCNKASKRKNRDIDRKERCKTVYVQITWFST